MKEKFLEAFQSWDPEMELTVKVRFIKKGTNKPLTGREYVVRLYDKDLFTADDYLGLGKLNDKGEAHIYFYPADVRKGDLIPEKLPDLYILLFQGNTVHFQTKVWEDVDFEKLGTFDVNEGEIVDFGTFLVD